VIETLKWLALLVMLAEHWMRYVVGELPPWVYNCGRAVFPLFVLSLALGLRSQPCGKVRDVLLRMLLWAGVAQVTIQFVDAPPGQLNVLFTFALGLAAAYGLGCMKPSFWVAIGLCVIGAVATQSEFGIVGVAFVAATVAITRAKGLPPVAYLVVLGSLVALAVPNGNHYALAAIPVAALVWVSRIRLPRLRGAFYWAYALQFPAFAGARWAMG
jgi:hypothetical protein